MDNFCLTISEKMKRDLATLMINTYVADSYSESYRLILINDAEKEVEKSAREIAALMRKERFEKLSKSEVDDASSVRYTYRDDLLVIERERLLLQRTWRHFL